MKPPTENKKKDQGSSGVMYDDFMKARQQWAKEYASYVTARAEKYFTTDDELPLSRHILLIAMAAVVFVFIVWASFARLDEVTRGDGKIIPSSEIQVIQNLEGGIIDDLLVKDGESVKAGQPVVRLRNTDALSNLGSNRARYFGLLATITRLQAEAEGRETVEFLDDVMKGAPQSVTEELNAFTANRTQLQSQIGILQQQLAQRRQEVSELRTKSADLASVIALQRQEKDMVAPLVEKGSAPKIELVQLERTIREKQTELNSVRQAIPRAESAIAEANQRIDEAQKTARAKAQTELSTKMIEMNAIKETLGALEDRSDRTEIKSPVNGTVKDIKFKTVGGVVKPGEPILEIVPVDDQLLIEARVKPADIAFLHPGQKAMVKITAYDFSIYGGLKGEVIDISPDSITNEKGESFYHIKVRTYETELKRNGEILPIIPGMVASIDILTGHKTVMEYLLKPIIKTVDTAMRER
jgi:adhesin transport system membrane fusion protein